MELLIAITFASLIAATPLLLAATGELVVERSGVLNLGVEGVMIVGAIGGFATAVASGSVLAGFIAAAVAGMALGLLFAALTQGLAANQVATGLALTILGLGLASLAGHAFVGVAIQPLQPLPVPLLSSIPVVGPALFQHDPMVYFALLAPVAVHLWLTRSHAGLILRSVGDAHQVAHALGYRVRMIRAGAISFGAAMAGLGGAYLSLAVTPLWAENMTAGRGWIALALVVFAGWYAPRLLTGALLFGFVLILQLHGQAMGLTIPSQILSMLPYAVTIVALVIFSQRAGSATAAGAPRMLGIPFMPTR